MSLLIFGSLFCLAVTLIYFYLKRQIRRTESDPPGEDPQILFGNIITSGLLSGKTTFTEILINYQRRFGDKFVFWFGPYPCVTFCKVEHVQTIFADRQTFDQSPLFLPNFDLLCPHGIFLPTGPKWKRHARVMIPMFKKAKIMHHSDIILQCTDRWIEQHLRRDGDIHTDLLKKCRTLTMNVIGLIAFDYDFDSAHDHTVRNAFETFGYQATLLINIPWMPRWLIRLYLKANWKYQQSRRIIRDLSEKIVEQEKSNRNPDEHEKPKNLIASLVSSLNEEANDEQISSGLTYVEMLDEVLVSILAGYETTSTALTWFMYFISKYPDVQKRMKEELRGHNLLMTDDMATVPPITYDIAEQLIYCDSVAKEVLRLAPVASVTTRIALQDTNVDNVPIRKNQTILIALHNINTDPRYWHYADPKQFVPERFLNEDKNHLPSAMIPFGGGHRACMGQDLARFELKLVIIRLMQRGVTFEDTPENTGGYAEEITCYPKNVAVRIGFDRPKSEA